MPKNLTSCARYCISCHPSRSSPMKVRRTSLVLAVAASLCISASAFSAPKTLVPADPSAAPGLNDAQLAEVQARIDLANRIVQNVSADAQAKGAVDSWRIGLLGVLYNTSSAALRGIADTAKTLDQAHAEAAEAHSSAAGTSAAGRASANDAVAAGLGDLDSLVFTTQQPCRFIDTRNVGGPIGTTVRVFDTFLSGPTYGGILGCTLPDIGRPAIAANVTIVGPSAAPGYLSIRPAGSGLNTSWINWYQSGSSVQAANSGVIAAALNASNHYAFEMLTGGGTTHVVLDYFGYFSAASPTALECRRVTVDFVVAANAIASSTAACPSSHTLTGVGCSGDPNYVVTYPTPEFASTPTTGYSSGGSAFCSARNSTSTASSARVSALCCRTP
ncbi:hypothetical protein [Rudaea sp.]|uniref:hypothetical protein n=1 Tax=Rudaea sp. TaxID=2136325 RepID=UPI002ED55E89